MTQNEKFIRVGVGFQPVMTSNFYTNPDGTNEVMVVIGKLIEETLNETITKALKVAHVYCEQLGVELQLMNQEEVSKHVQYLLNNGEYGSHITGVYSEESDTYVTDPEHTKHILSGSPDN